jgi:hypothetical protein
VAAVVSPIINYFLTNNLCKDYTAIEGEMSTLVTLNFPNTGDYQRAYYFASNNMLDGQNCTITAIEVVLSTELTRLPSGEFNVDSSILPNGVLYVSNLKRQIIATLPLYGLQRTANNGKPTFTYFNDQVWQNCYVEFTSTGFTTPTTPLTFRVYYVPKIKN